jgi:hypothetical protein
MTHDEFTRHAAAWGADIARWPEAIRAEAVRFAATTPDGKAILADEERLEANLRTLAPDVTQARIDRAMQRVVTALAEPEPRPRFPALLSRWLIPAAGLACAVGIGALAATVGPLADNPDETRGVLTMIFDMTSIGQGFSL